MMKKNIQQATIWQNIKTYLLNISYLFFATAIWLGCSSRTSSFNSPSSVRVQFPKAEDLIGKTGFIPGPNDCFMVAVAGTDINNGSYCNYTDRVSKLTSRFDFGVVYGVYAVDSQAVMHIKPGANRRFIVLWAKVNDPADLSQPKNYCKQLMELSQTATVRDVYIVGDVTRDIPASGTDLSIQVSSYADATQYVDNCEGIPGIGGQN